MQSKNKLKIYHVKAYGLFDEYDVISMVVLAENEQTARTYARLMEHDWHNRIVIAEEISGFNCKVLSYDYAEEACEIYPDDFCGF